MVAKGRGVERRDGGKNRVEGSKNSGMVGRGREMWRKGMVGRREEKVVRKKRQGGGQWSEGKVGRRE